MWVSVYEVYKTERNCLNGNYYNKYLSMVVDLSKAKFGDRFRTRSGNLAIFTYYSEAGYRLEINMWTFITESHTSGYHCGEHGRVVDYDGRFGSYTERTGNSDLDIVAKWDEQ